MVANLPNYLTGYRRQTAASDQPEENYLQMMLQQIAMMGAPPPAEMVSPPQWRNQRVAPTPPFVHPNDFRDDIFRLPPTGPQLGFDRMGEEDAYWNWVVPRVYGPQPPGARTDPQWRPRRLRARDL